MIGFLVRAVAVIVLLLLGLIAAGGLMSLFTPKPPLRGQMVDIGGRSMHLVCEGPATGSPTVLFESGAFGFSADWAVVQARLAAKGVRSCAYDRAGLGFSDPGPGPRDGAAVMADLDALLAAAHVDGPYIYVGHSMAGLYARIFTARHADEVAGVVLCDAATGEVTEAARTNQFVTVFARIAKISVVAARVGILKVFSPLADTIGLPGSAAAEKRWTFGRVSQNVWAANEVGQWRQTASQAAASAPYSPSLPVAVVLAGEAAGERGQARGAPARASRSGYFTADSEANHASLLGEDHAEAILKAIEHVMKAAAQR